MPKEKTNGKLFIYLFFSLLTISIYQTLKIWSAKNSLPNSFKENINYDDFTYKTLPSSISLEQTIYNLHSKEKKILSAIKKTNNNYKIIKGTVRRDDTLWGIFTKNKINPSLFDKIVKASKGIYNLSKLKKGELYTIIFSPEGELKEILLETKKEKILTIKNDNGKIFASLKPIEYETDIASISSTINGSLFEAVIKEDEKSQLASLLTNIFAWQIDFFLDLRKGDTFKAIFEKKYRDGKFVKYGKILGAKLTNRKKTFLAIFYENPSGQQDYFNEKGKSLRKQFLKSPLTYTRISSGFTKKRFHPILKRYMAHLGIDYAAPYGTPIRAVGDGRVIWSRRKGPNGHLVIIKHNHIYTTTYSHLSRYAKKIRKGVYVKQGQIIGYVGSTGRSTGPHLDFHVKKYGRSINPLKLKIPASNSIKRKYKKAFIAKRNYILEKLNNISTEKIMTPQLLIVNREKNQSELKRN